MDQDRIIQLKQGLSTAFINQNISSNLAYKPQFVSNNYKEGRKVISSIEDELLSCEEFAISVAFVTMGGITPLLQTLRELEQRGIPGKVLTTDYLTFSDPKALRILANFRNIELKMFVTENAKEGFHTKGYIFKKEEMYRIIVGSSNMTLSALTTNREWNTKIVSTEQGEYMQNVVAEFEQLWNAQQSLTFEQFIEAYTNVYTKNKIIQKQKEIAKQAEVPSLEVYRLQPNSMQVGFINNLKKIYESGEDKALLISATGTGKTYASAFAARELEFKRVLFLVHRNQIAKQALKSYRKVFDGKVSMGMVTGKYQDYDADFVFATVQTLSKEDTLSRYKKEHWDLIIIDEAHHSSADSYKKIMDYFTPKLWLGMTATPDKRDDNLEGRNIYEIFNHQIAYEIRLQNAMEEDLLCPFHYFGITDLEVIADAGKSAEEKVENFRYLTSDERVLNVMKQAEFFGHSGERVKGGNDYISYVKELLSGEVKEKKEFKNYDLILMTDFAKFNDLMYQREQEIGLVRMAAGYAWDWLSKNDKTIYDIEIQGIKKQWNHCTEGWVHSENAINEVGCIHSTQGYDLNYAFIIIGNEMGYDPDKKKIVVRAENYYDQNGKKTAGYEELLEYIQHIYYVLMTRGIRGTYLYVCDQNLKEYMSQYVDTE